MLTNIGVVTDTRGPIRIHVEYVDEGEMGDFDPTDPADAPRLRFWVYAHPDAGIEDTDPDMDADPDGYQFILNTSYCTDVTLGRNPDTEKDHAVMAALAAYLSERLAGITTGHGLRAATEDLSWVTNDDIAGTRPHPIAVAG